MSEEIEETKKSKWWVKIIIGVSLLLCAGGAIHYGYAPLASCLSEIGTACTVQGVVEEYPNSKDEFIKAADIIDAAIEARVDSPEDLIAIISDKLSIAGETAQIKLVMSIVITKINEAYKISSTETTYIDNLRSISKGIRVGCE